MTDNISSKNKYFSERIQHWDTIANKSFSNSNNYYHRYLERIYQYIIPPRLRVLELGCGKGELLAAVNPSDGVGVDQSGEMIKQASEKFPQLHFLHSRGEEVQLEGTFDVIILSDCVTSAHITGRIADAMTPANVLYFGASVGFFKDRNDLGLGKSASFHHGLLAVILPESSSYDMSTFLGKLTINGESFACKWKINHG